MSFDDFAPPKSDIDMLVLTNRPIDAGAKCTLASLLSHSNIPCPAAGLDLILTDAACARTLPEPVRFDFSISTGETWATEIEHGSAYEELLIEFAICRAFGHSMFGPEARSLIAEVPRTRINSVLLAVIDWHRRHVHDPFHDPLGHYAVLNACRAYRHISGGELCSKTGGGEWFIGTHPTTSVVREALAIRACTRSEKLDRAEVLHFLDDVKRLAATYVSSNP
jgi:hypothetical protein